MKNTKINSGSSKNWLRRTMIATAIGVISAAGMSAQSSLPAPGTGGSFNPAPINNNPPAPIGRPGWGANGIGWNPGPNFNNPGPGPAWNNPNWQNQGTMNVMACGYDAQGIWRTLPLYVSYSYNGIEYDVTVLNAWNPWTSSWNVGVDMPAYNTSYYINGQNYDFYAPLSTGTYYFNL